MISVNNIPVICAQPPAPPMIAAAVPHNGSMDSTPHLFDLPHTELWNAAALEALHLLATNPLELVAEDWARALAPQEAALRRVGAMLVKEYDGGIRFLPQPSQVLRALSSPLDKCKVLIVGQDPYPTPGHSVGLAFSVARNTRQLPRSLNNIYKELHSDLGIAPAAHGDLTAWAEQGVLLLNRVLSVPPGRAGAHRGRGWEEITEAVIAVLAARQQPLVSVLWGRDAQRLAPLLAGTEVIESAHPSPLSASRGFFGSKPFSRINTSLVAQGCTPIEWKLPA